MTRPRLEPAGEIATLAARPDLIDTVAEWIWSAFWKRHGTPYIEVRALVAASNAVTGPPQCLVRLVDGEPVGTAALIVNDLASRPDLTPWLAAMYVRPEARGRGHARALIAAVEQAARDAGVERIWLYTFTAEGLYLKCGWRSVERFEVDGVEVALMRRELGPGPAVSA